MAKEEKTLSGNNKTVTDMTNAQLERLALLVEECAEVQQISMKIVRHGYESYHPLDQEKKSNKKLLERELGDLVFAIGLLASSLDINMVNVNEHKWNKKNTINKYLHHNEV